MKSKTTGLSTGIINELLRRDAELTVLKRKNVRDTLIEVESQSALIEMTLKAKQAKDGSAKEFWESNLLKAGRALDLVNEYKNELATVEMLYNKLYSEYSRLVDVVEKLKQEMN